MINKDKKLFLFDVDGTLLTDEKVVSNLTREQILRVSQMGHICAIASGRTPLYTLDVAAAAGITHYIVGNNGTNIYDIRTGQTFLNGSVPQEAVDYYIEIAKKYKRELSWAMGTIQHRVYFGNDPKIDIDDRSFHIGGSLNVVYDSWDEVKSDLYPGKNSIQHITFKAERKIIAQVIEDFRKKLSKISTITEVSEVYIDCNPLGTNKYVGAQYVQRLENITNENTYAFGDSENDLVMIKESGHGVAMANARENIKKVAKHITLSNNDDGIGVFLKKNIK